MDPPEPAMMNRAYWGVETVERWRGTVGSGNGGAAARRGGDWSAGVMQWGAAVRHGGEWRQWSGGMARWGVECRCDKVESGGATWWGVETVECGVTRWGLGSGVRCGRWRGRVQQRGRDFIHSA
jgi:hypothetical protein